MHLSEICLEGFKSYAQRTVISGWDQEFNAITGLNGSGKSNILDAICFVLGISNLSQVRATNLQDLVYKQGQAGINKATVSLVFDNRDPKLSPIGYEHKETIEVTRQIIIGGRNKYMINGATAQQQNVQNLFQSVGLNVNNPHFLIMQGRITKVLNMKPKEILGLIEEAAGTRMFEVKKEQAVKTIEKKQEKVDQITRVLDEEITPTLKKLQEERANYLKWAANNTECERLSRLCIAWDYTQADKLRTGSAEAVAKLQADVSAAIKGATAFRTAAEAKSKEITAADAKLASARSGEHSALASTVDGLSKDVSRAEGAHKVKSAELAVEEKGRDNAIKAAKDGETQRATLAATQAKQRADAGVAKEEADRLGKTASSLQAKLTAVRAGMTGEGEGTVAEQLMAAKAAVTKLGGAANKADMTAKAEAAKIKDLQAAVKSAEGQSGALTQALQLGAQKLEKHRAELAALNFDARKHDALKTQREALAAEVFKAADEQERATEGLGASFGFSYDKKAMGTSWDERRVRGTVASLIRVKPAHMGAAEALGVVAGGKLTHVVVDSDETGKMLLEKGKSRRVTLVPLNTIRSRAPTPAQVAAAASLGPGRAVLASSCVSADAAYNKVLEYVFGAAFICDSDETAKRVAFGDGMRCLAVTLAGDVFDPAGTLEGGAPQSAGKGGVPIMVRVGQVNELGDRLASSKAELAALDVILVSMTKAAAVYTEKEEQVTRMEHSQGLLQQTLAGSSLGEAQRNLELATKKVETETATSAAAKVALKEAAAKVEALSAEMKNAEKIREQRVKAVEGELEKASKEAGVAETKAKALIKAAEQSGYDLEALTKSTGVEAALIAERSAAVAALVKEVAVLSAALAAVRAKYEAAKAKLEAAQEAIAAADKARTKLFKEREADLSAADDEDRKTRALEGEVKKTQSAGAAAEKGVSDLLVRYPWIASERANFGMQFSDYDFKTADPKAAQTKLNGLAKQQADLEKRINKKVMGMIESAEREYAELRGKKSIIENDKDKINRVIAELDEKKNEALKTTWAKVNKDFGSIFTTLLPGTTSKLEPPEGGSVLEGLEVKVAFNGVWKESLTELSGGQRSLLALSLILSLLLFKPAPMYILDEVDAALDMSHTQNIGVMIRKYFSQSQFIVVSLKQGMFSNANIIFRTKFVDGTSTVLRTIPAGHELLGRGMEEEEENAGPKGKGGRKAKEDEEEGPKPAKRRGGPLAAV